MISSPTQDGLEGYGVAVFFSEKNSNPIPLQPGKIFQTAALFNSEIMSSDPSMTQTTQIW